MIGIDLFSGAGGMSLGAENAGVDVRYAVEIDRHASATYRANHPKTILFQTDILQLKRLQLNVASRDLLVFGGPPCQGYSTSNQRTRDKNNPQNWLFLEFLRIIRELEPRVVVFENVSGLLEKGRKAFLDGIVGGLRRQGYQLASGLLNAAHFGVPQNRSRFFIMGTKSKRALQLPTGITSSLISVRDAIADLPILRNGASANILPYRTTIASDYQRAMREGLTHCSGHIVTCNAPSIVLRYKHIPQGGNWSSIPADLMTTYADVERCHTGIYRRLCWSEPSIVIGNFRKNMLVHPSQNRGLSVREAARLQSFPDSHCFFGSIGKQQQQVGNAVPPLLAQAVFKAVLSQV